MTRTVRDAAALLDAVCGPAPAIATTSGARGARSPRRRGPTPVHSGSRCNRVLLGQRHRSGGAERGRDGGAHPRGAGTPRRAGGDARRRGGLQDTPPDRLALARLVATLATALGEIAGREPSEANVETATLACIRHTRRRAPWISRKARRASERGLARVGRVPRRLDLFLSPTTPAGPPPAGSIPPPTIRYTPTSSAGSTTSMPSPPTRRSRTRPVSPRSACRSGPRPTGCRSG